MSSTATCVYHVAQGGLSISALQAAVAAVPVPQDLLSALGVRVTSDVTAPTSPGVSRTIVFSLIPSSAAAAVAALFGGDPTGSPLDIVTVTAAGADYVQPPQVLFSATNPPADTPANGFAYLKVIGTTLVSGGSGYNPATTTAVVTGSLPPNRSASVAPTVTLSITGGVVSVSSFTPGTGLVGVPTVSIIDTSGAGIGAAINLRMGVDVIDISNPGRGYESAPTVTLNPWFLMLFPNTSNQAAPFAELMTNAISLAVLCPVEADPPVIA